MVLLKHGNFEFKNILSEGYNITEDEPDVLSESTMADGSIRRNYGKMPKTHISITFSQLDKDTYQEYISHFSNNEDVYSYFSPKQQKMLTKKFFVTFPELSILSITKNHRYDEFEVELEQCGEVSE
jgi:hypothetical protein